jgi:ABC-type molybdate transport system substrate-binding protein
MKKVLAVLLTAVALLAVAPAAAQAKGGTATGAWPVASAPLPAGAIQSQSSTQAVVLADGTVTTALAALDAKYSKLGYTVGVSAGIPRWYRNSQRQVNVFYAWWDGTHSYFTLNKA